MPSPSQALELENFLPYRLSILAQIVSESLHDLYAEPFGLTVTQWRVMAALAVLPPSPLPMWDSASSWTRWR